MLLGASAGAAEIAGNEQLKLKVKLGGFFYGALHYDSNAAANRPWLNVVNSDAERDVLSVDPYGTRTHFAVESTGDGPNQGKGFLEIDWGPMTSPRIRHAYVTLDTPALSLLVGQTWVSSATPGPDTYNPQWLFRQGNPYTRAPQATLSRTFGPLKASATVTTALFLGGSVIKGIAAPGTYALAEGLNPTGLLQLTYPVLQKGILQVTGGLGRAEAAYSGPDTQRRAGADTVYAELAFSVPVSALTLTGKGFYSAGAGMGTAVGQTLVINADGAAAAIPSYGGFLSAKVALGPAALVAAYFGMDDPRDTVADVQVPIERNVTLGGHLTWLPLDALNVALEVMHVRTQMHDARGRLVYTNTRPSLVLRYSF